MAASTFDTLKFTEQLIEAGYTEQQAKGTVRAYQTVFEGSEIATKRDLKELELSLKIELIKWMIGVTVTTITIQTGILIWVFKNSVGAP